MVNISFEKGNCSKMVSHESNNGEQQQQQQQQQGTVPTSCCTCNFGGFHPCSVQVWTLLFSGLLDSTWIDDVY